MNINRHKFLAGIVPSVILAATTTLAAMSADVVVAKTTLITTACGKLFEIDSNADGLTAAERASIVQKNLDNALISARDRSPAAVRVEMKNRNPIVTLDGLYIVTADGNSAARNRISQLELARKWADSIKFCLADATAIKNYIALLTGNYSEKKAVVITAKDDIAVMTSDMFFPVQLSSPLSAFSAALGDKIEAVVSHDVPLGPSYETYLPAGTIASGQVVSAAKYVNPDEYNRHGYTVDFYEFRTPDGHKIPITGHFAGSINAWKQVSFLPSVAECCNKPVSVSSTGDSVVAVKIVPSKGRIVGGWKGTPLDPMSMPMNRFSFNRAAGLSISQGEPMMLQLSAPSAIAVAGSSM